MFAHHLFLATSIYVVIQYIQSSFKTFVEARFLGSLRASTDEEKLLSTTKCSRLLNVVDK